MTNLQSGAAAGFTPGERDYIRRELDMFFSTYPRVADGFQLKTWRGGPQAGQAKVPPTAKGRNPPPEAALRRGRYGVSLRS